MAQCLKCKLEFGDQIPDYCPVCQTICYTCPWCGRMTDASQEQCAMLDCGRPIKYLRMTPDLRDVMRLESGEVVQIGHVAVRIERALYASQRVTVYRGQVTRTTGGRKSEPAAGQAVVLREVMDEYAPQAQSLVTKLASLRHPNIVRTYFGEPNEERSCWWLLQAWVGDRSLATEHLEELGGQAPPDAALARIAQALARAVRQLHTSGVIHCDITPFNVLLAQDGTPVLSDFGLARLAEDVGTSVGYTSGYAPLEMHPPDELPGDLPGRNLAVGPHTDRYMLGTTLFAVACGRDGRSVHPVTRTPILVSAVDRALYDLGIGGAPQTPIAAFRFQIDPAVASWIETLMSMPPGERFASDDEMVKRARPRRSGRGGGRRFTPIYRGLGRVRRIAKLAGAAIAVLAVVILLRHGYTIVHSPRNLPSLILADAELAIGLPSIAVLTLERSPAPSAEVDYLRGRALERMDKPDEALGMYKESLKRDQTYGPAKKAAARLRSRLGSACLQRGMQLYRSGEYYLADKQLSKSVHYGSCSADGYLALARIAQRRGDIARAAGHIDTLSRLNPSSVKLHYRAALLFLDSGNLEKAYHHTAKARDLWIGPKPEQDVPDEDMADLREEVSAACLRAASLDLARATRTRQIHEKMVWLQRAENLNPSPAVYMKLAAYHKRLGDLCAGDRRANHYAQAEEYRRKARGR